MSAKETLYAIKSSWDEEQRRLSRLRVEVEASTAELLPELRFVGGLDISFEPSDTETNEEPLNEDEIRPETSEICVACLAVFEIPPTSSATTTGKRKPMEPFVCYSLPSRLKLPYIPGYLGFRELPLYRHLLALYRTEYPDQFASTVFMVDGNGLLHPRMFGSATHLGVVENVPTFGVAKNLLCLPELGSELTIEFIKSDTVKSLLIEKGDHVLLHGKRVGENLDGNEDDRPTDEVYGAALISSATSHNPVFVSQGFRLPLEQCVEIVYRTSVYRIPDPIRRADNDGRRDLAKLIERREKGEDIEKELFVVTS